MEDPVLHMISTQDQQERCKSVPYLFCPNPQALIDKEAKALLL